MANVYRVVDDVVAAARARERTDLAEAVSSISAENRALVAADLGFALLHLVVCSVAERLLRHGYPAKLERNTAGLTVELHSNFVTCTHYVGDATVRIRFCGPGSSIAEWEHSWTPPVSTDAAAIHGAAEQYAERIARHLLGSS